MSVQRYNDEMEVMVGRYESQRDEIARNGDLSPAGREKRMKALRDELLAYAQDVIPKLWGRVVPSDRPELGSMTLDPDGLIWRESAALTARLQDAINKAENAALDVPSLTWGATRARAIVADAKRAAGAGSLADDETAIPQAIQRAYESAPDAVKIAMQDASGDLIQGQGMGYTALRRRLQTDREKRITTPQVRAAQQQSEALFLEMDRALGLSKRLAGLLVSPGFGMTEIPRILEGISRISTFERGDDGRQRIKQTIEPRYWGVVWRNSDAEGIEMP